MEKLPFCKCGCGEKVSKSGNKYINGHHLGALNKQQCERLKKLNKKQWQDPKRRKKQSKTMKKQWQDSEFRKKVSQATHKNMKKQWQDDKFQRKVSEAAKKRCQKLWQDPEYQKMQSEKMKKVNKKLGQKDINQSEQKLLDLMKSLGINDFLFTGNPTCNIRVGKYWPDFTCKKQKKIVEFFAEYWHPNKEDAPDRVKYYKKLGWECIVVWLGEFKDMEKLKKKLLNFCKSGTEPYHV